MVLFSRENKHDGTTNNEVTVSICSLHANGPFGTTGDIRGTFESISFRTEKINNDYLEKRSGTLDQL